MNKLYHKIITKIIGDSKFYTHTINDKEYQILDLINLFIEDFDIGYRSNVKDDWDYSEDFYSIYFKDVIVFKIKKGNGFKTKDTKELDRVVSLYEEKLIVY